MRFKSKKYWEKVEINSEKEKLTKTIREEVLKNEDFIRILKETSIKLDLPYHVVKRVVSNFLLQFPFLIYPRKYLTRFSIFGFINIIIKPKKRV